MNKPLLLLTLLIAHFHAANAAALDSFPNATNAGEGWYYTWMGWMWTYDESAPWIWSEDHEWLYIPGNQVGSVWAWEDKMDWWMWTSEFHYPIVINMDGEWYRYVYGTSSPRVYWSYTESENYYDLYYDIPEYEPSYWNDNIYVRRYNNCYNYSCNKKTNSFAQPGRASGSMYNPYDISVEGMTAALLSDGIEIGTASGPVPEGKARIALVVRPGSGYTGADYHFYRQDDNGRWTHKPGQTAATFYDNSGYEITNPELADWGMYTEFGGYFFVDSSDIQGEGNENIY